MSAASRSRAYDAVIAADVLRQRFGFASFRGQQEDAVKALVANRDVLYISATGSGKSLTYQFPTQVSVGGNWCQR